MKDFKRIHKHWQDQWARAKLFQAEPDKNKEKFFATIPYPYISGSLHIGHARVVTEMDVYTRYLRMTGKNVLFPLAFHISGTPVLGISLAIKNGNQKTIELYKSYVRNYVPEEKVAPLIKSFEEPQNIVDFFIPLMKEEFATLGLGVDWRRSFNSGDAMHQKLVEWQFLKYKEKGYVTQGDYPILYSLTLQNAVGEDDIKDGDTNPVDINEFTLIKFRFEDGFLIAATLRPETMYGQTNMWVGPDIDYIKADVDGEIWYVSEDCVEKLKHQKHKVNVLARIKGKDLIGKTCFAPFVEREIIILPSQHCDPDIGTGIVTSVPSDAPFDWIALKELQDNPEQCRQHGLDHTQVKDIKLIPIIKSKGYGDYPAIEICEKMGITSLAQHDTLGQATQEIYKAGFHTGVMMDTCGPYAGMPVTKAKQAMKDALIKEGRAATFYETSRPAQSRDGGKVLVAILENQWFLDFNASGWKEVASECLAHMSIVPEKYRKRFQDVFAWLDKRPCARRRGLGTKLPFDPDWVIESLSDSTIYMALYPIAHLLRKHKLNAQQMSPAFFDYVMLGEGPAPEGVSKQALDELQESFTYWYPNDHRHTFPAHLSNHLSFMIFAHTAIFPKNYWPKKITFHGMINSEGHKMSKSKGNVVTLLELNEQYGADVFRAFMCNATSVESTLNWESKEVARMQKHLRTLQELFSRMIQERSDGPLPPRFDAHISRFERAKKNAGEHLSRMELREYSTLVLYEIHTIYKKAIRGSNDKDVKSFNNNIISDWISLLAPLVPHLAEEVWSQLGHEGFVSTANWPAPDESKIDERADALVDMLENTLTDTRKVFELAKIAQPKKVTYFIAPPWKYALFKELKDALQETRDVGAIMKRVMGQEEFRTHGKALQKLLPAIIKDPSKIPLILLDSQSERTAMEQARKELEQELSCAVDIVPAQKSEHPKAKSAMPLKPAILAE